MDLISDANDHELLAVVGEGLRDSFGAAEELNGDILAEDGDVFAEAIIEELAVLKLQRDDFLEVGRSGNDADVLMNVISDFDGGTGDCQRRNGGNAFDFRDSFDILKGQVGFDVLITRGEFVNDAVGEGFASAWTDKDKVGVLFGSVSADKAINAASEGKNENDGGNANSNTESREESAATIAVKAIDGEFKMRIN